MKNIDSKNGYQLKITGAPSIHLHRLDTPTRVALLPEKIPFIKPRLKVKEGEHVQVGSPLIEDKRKPDIHFGSPGCGVIEEIKFGPRRVVQEIAIRLDNLESKVPFASYSEADIEILDRTELLQAIITGGLWPLLRELPARDYPNPGTIPPAIFVNLGSLEPFKPAATVYLTGQQELFKYGLKLLGHLTEGAVHVSCHRNDKATQEILTGAITHCYSGPYPAHDPGTLLYHTRTSTADNRAWYIDGQDLLLIAELLREGAYPTKRVVTLAGSGVSQPRHIQTRLGAPLADIVGDDRGLEGRRYIQGGILTGFSSTMTTYLGLFETALNLLPAGDQMGELLGLIRPGYEKASFSKTFLSHLNDSDMEIDCNMHGGDRACIACGYCTKVCPVDILPHFTFKALHIDEIEEALEHGLLDCVECGLCSYVCPAKIELTQRFKDAKTAYHKEGGGR